jgi:pimeloyl-ACP methyl ester carboxylesterase
MTMGQSHGFMQGESADGWCRTRNDRGSGRRRNSMSSSFLASDGNRIDYTIDDFTDPWRPPATLLLLHAAMGSSKRWYGAVPLLCRRYRVVRMDLRGHGESQVPPPEPPLSMDRLVQDVRELLDRLDCGPVHIVGNSAGGYVAQNLAMASPERVRSLMLFGSTPGLKNSEAHTWLPRVAREGLRNFLAATIEDRFPHGHDRGHIEWFLDEAAKNNTAYIGRFVGLMTTLWWADELPRIKCPTLLVMPGAETVGSTLNYEIMRAKIPDCELITYEGLPHNICDIAPDRCAADILAFLRRRFP